jgi:tRNA nucleotidyltransferase/poly(A) polymerase
MIICPECGLEFEPKGYARFCSKSCGAKHSNRERVKNGTCNLLKKNGGSESAKSHNKDMIEKGIHPFLKNNFSDESKLLAAEGISKARIRETESGMHPWQDKISRANNEFSRASNKYKGINSLSFYIAKFPDIDTVVKLGVTSIGNYRSNDYRYPLEDLKILFNGPTKLLLELERELRIKFGSKENYELTKSWESYSIDKLDEIRQFILNYSESSTTIEKTENFDIEFKSK